MTADNARWGVAFALASMVTLAAAIPLGVLAWQARNEVAVASDGLVIHVAGTIAELDGFVLAPGTPAELTLDDPQVVAAAWALYATDGTLKFSGESVGTAPLKMSLRADALSRLPPGPYELLVSATMSDGGPSARAARFRVGAQ